MTKGIDIDPRSMLNRCEALADSVRFAQPLDPSTDKLSDAICGIILVIRFLHPELSN